MHPLQFFSKLLPIGLPLPILRGPAKGFHWMVGAAPGPSKGLSVLWNQSEPHQLREAARISQGAKICFDIGAHAGLYTLVFSKQAQRVYSFEPFPPNLAWLSRTLQKNKITNATVLPWAVAGQTQTLSFEIGEHSSLGRLNSQGTLPVFAITLVDFIDRYFVEPHVLKIDVEGAETELIIGGQDFLIAKKPAILLSIHGPDKRKECLKLLREYGYQQIKPLGNRNLDSADEYCIEA